MFNALGRLHCAGPTLLIAALCVCSFGCGKFKVAPVSGVITLETQPLEDATVTFTPQSSVEGEVPVSSGRTDAQGQYTLQMVSDGTDGALIGKHSVRISRNIETESDIMTPEEARKTYLPQHDFTFEVVSGSNQADFDLESRSGR